MKGNYMNQEKFNLTIEMPRTGFDPLALRHLGGLVAAHVGLSFEETATDTLRFDLGERAPTETQEGAAFISELCQQAKQGQTALYCRSAIVNPEAITRQRENLQLFAEEQGFGSIAHYEDDGYSGLDRDRPDFLRLEADIRGGKIQRVLTMELSRLGKNIAEVIRWAVWSQRHGAEIFALEDPINDLLENLENA
jgi:hypothetical protein